MSQHSAHLRKLANPSDPKTSMDPTLRKHPKSPPFTTATSTTTPTPSSTATKPHSTPTNVSSPTVQTISSHFSRLYTNHKVLEFLKPSSGHPHPQPCVDTHFQTKAMSLSTIEDGPVSSLTKSSRKYRKSVSDLKTDHCPRTNFAAAKVKEKETISIKNSVEDHLDTKREIVSYKAAEIKKSSKKEREERVFQLEGQNIKKPIVEMEAKLEILKGFHEGSVLVAGKNSGGRRRSFCSSQTELADFMSCNGVKVVSADMPPFMQIHAVDFARKTYDSLEKFTAKTLASTLKKEFDGAYGPAWHCIVGTSFGSFVTHSVGGFLYFSMDHKLYILLFKTTVRKAE